MQVQEVNGNNDVIEYVPYTHTHTHTHTHTQEEQISEEMEIDHRVHSRLIGQKGKAIAKVMERFKVDIRFPRDKQSSTVVITGLEENVEDAKEHLYTLTEDYVSMGGWKDRLRTKDSEPEWSNPLVPP